MRKPRLVQLCAVAAGLALAGCAPSFGSFGPGVQIGMTPGAGLQIAPTSCSLLSTQSPAGLAVTTSRSASAFGVMNKISALQAKFMLSSSDVRARTESWKRLASGDC